jgi:hypothetical protein
MAMKKKHPASAKSFGKKVQKSLKRSKEGKIFNQLFKGLITIVSIDTIGHALL